MNKVKHVLTKVAKWLLVISSAVILTACEFGVSGGPTINPRKPVIVALLVPSGGDVGEDFLADQMIKAAKMAQSDIRGAEIDLRIYSTAGNSARAAAMATKAVAEGAKIILGPLHAEAANAVGVAVGAQKINVLAFSNNTSIAGGNVFVLGTTFNNVANRMVSYAKTRSLHNIGVVYPQNIAGDLGRDAVISAVRKYGANFAGAGAYELTSEGISSAAPRIATMMKVNGANALLFADVPQAGLVPMTGLMRDNGISKNTQFAGLTRWDTPMEALSAAGLQGGWYAISDPNSYQQFAARYKGRFGKEPHVLAGIAYDGMAAIGALIATGKSSALRVSSITKKTGFAGVNGIFRLNKDGSNDRALAIMQVNNGSARMISPAPTSFNDPSF